MVAFSPQNSFQGLHVTARTSSTFFLTTVSHRKQRTDWAKPFLWWQSPRVGPAWRAQIANRMHPCYRSRVNVCKRIYGVSSGVWHVRYKGTRRSSQLITVSLLPKNPRPVYTPASGTWGGIAPCGVRDRARMSNSEPFGVSHSLIASLLPQPLFSLSQLS